MLGILYAIFCTFGFFSGILTGNLPAVSDAVLTSGRDAVQLTLSLLGIMGLWGGVMRVLEKTGMASHLAARMRPLLTLLFPDACRRDKGDTEIAAALSANLLGMGNASTPLSLRAMEKLRENSPDDPRPSADMTVFCVLSCSPFTLLPATVISLRQSAGAVSPADILIPIWIVSAASALFATLLARAMTALGRKRP